MRPERLDLETIFDKESLGNQLSYIELNECQNCYNCVDCYDCDFNCEECDANC
jgi:hypothetical protein